MERMTGGAALVHSLVGHGVDTVFGLPGVQMDALFNALHDNRELIRVVGARHEQGVAYMAFGYAQATGRVGTYAAVPGPGFLNTTAALSTAYACNAPVLALIGQIPSASIGRGHGLLHEIPNQLGILQSLTKWAARIDHPSQAPDAVAEAFRQLTSGRKRPVGLEMAPDMMALAAPVALATPHRAAAPPEPDSDQIKEAAKALAGAASPVIVVGSGVFGAIEELQAVAERLQAPVAANRLGRGALSSAHPLSITQTVLYRLWPKADVILAVGSRLSTPRLNWNVRPGQTVIHIDIDPTELKRVGRPHIGIVADAKPALAALLGKLARLGGSRPSREAETREQTRAMLARLDSELGPQMAYLKVLRDELPADGILVDEFTQVGYLARVAFPVYAPRTFITSGYQGTLGYGYATALGVQIGQKRRKVLSITGDGGFLFTANELATAVNYRIPVVVVVFDDGAYGNVKRMQVQDYGGRVIASELSNPDFAAYAESFGAMGLRADSPEQLRAALRRGFAADHPVVIAVKVGEMPDPWPILSPRQPP
jgi:acetolactate synthase-1/2/3 large subunit